VAPTGKEAARVANVLQREGLRPCVCGDLIALREELPRGAGALLIEDEALRPKAVAALVASLARQPAWFDVPVLLLTHRRGHEENLRVIQELSPVGNVTLLERPLSTLALVTAVQAALRTRRRQHQVRALLEEQKQAAEALRASQQQVLELNAELEQRVSQRTAELRAANAELEAFCYSVSHDLRAPLRAIDGFALAVLERGSDRLDDTARSYLERARLAARRMQQLINDLLSLSRLSRTQMNIERVDLSVLAEAIARELQQAEPERTAVEFRIAPDLCVRGDAALLRIALENLLGNAWKFTSKRDCAVIELKAETRDGTPGFCVRDNGAGFDMAYASKLFTPFQRLHTSHEFPGSGIGLAIVQRILRRHDGEVWAEGKRGQGACIYFRLPPAVPALVAQPAERSQRVAVVARMQ